MAASPRSRSPIPPSLIPIGRGLAARDALKAEELAEEAGRATGDSVLLHVCDLAASRLGDHAAPVLEQVALRGGARRAARRSVELLATAWGDEAPAKLRAFAAREGLPPETMVGILTVARGRTALELALRAYPSHDASVRGAASRVLAGARPADAFPLVPVGARLLGDEQPAVRHNAAALLGAVGGERVAPWLADALTRASADERSPLVFGLVSCTGVRPPPPDKPLDPLPGTRGERHWSQADGVVAFYLTWCKQHRLAVEPPPANPEWHYRAEYVAYVHERPDDPLAAVAIDILTRSAGREGRKEFAGGLRKIVREHPGTQAAREADQVLRRP